jgi:hypothetical protein
MFGKFGSRAVEKASPNFSCGEGHFMPNECNTPCNACG